MSDSTRTGPGRLCAYLLHNAVTSHRFKLAERLHDELERMRSELKECIEKLECM